VLAIGSTLVAVPQCCHTSLRVYGHPKGTEKVLFYITVSSGPGLLAY